MAKPAVARLVAGDRRAPSRGDRQRAALIQTVTELLAEVSIADLSVMQIAKRAEVTRPVFYFYFEPKYAAVAAALAEVWEEFDAARTVVDPPDLEQEPATFTRGLISAADEVWHRHRALLTACVQARASDPQLAGMWDQFVESQTGRVLELLMALKGRGAIRPVSADVPALIEALIGMTLWMLLGDQGSGRRVPITRQVDAVTAVWLASVWGA